MRAALFALATLLCGAAWAQGGTPADTGAVCRSFCDADAGRCRKDAAFDASVEADPLVDFRPRADKDDYSSEKYDQARRAADKDRFTRSQKCGATRLACRQKCMAPPAAGDGASAPR